MDCKFALVPKMPVKGFGSLCVPDCYFFLGIPTGFSPPAQGCGCAATLENALYFSLPQRGWVHKSGKRPATSTDATWGCFFFFQWSQGSPASGWPTLG